MIASAHLIHFTILLLESEAPEEAAFIQDSQQKSEQPHNYL